AELEESTERGSHVIGQSLLLEALAPTLTVVGIPRRNVVALCLAEGAAEPLLLRSLLGGSRRGALKEVTEAVGEASLGRHELHVLLVDDCQGTARLFVDLGSRKMVVLEPRLFGVGLLEDQ